jgi:hypothetical protein
MKFVRPRQFLAAAALLLLGLGLAAAAARALTPQEERSLFSFGDLGAVDLTPKRLTVEVYLSPDPQLNDCRRLFPLVWQQVQAFYARMGVLLQEVSAGPEPGPLAPARRLRVELLADKEWLNRSFKAFNVAYPFRLRFLQVCKDKCAFAHLPLSTVHISFKRFQTAQFSSRPGEEHLNRNWLANLLTHELGHLLGLYHAHEFVNDPVAVGLTDNGAPNFMGQNIAFQSSLGFGEFQKRLVHSYLGQGKVYRQYQQVNFDPLRYLEVVKRVNGFKEPLSRVAKVATGVKKKGKIKTFDGSDDEDDDDD